MSIVELRRITLVGFTEDKAQVLDDLQTLGGMHVIPLTTEGEAAAAEGPSRESREALRFLLSCPQKRHQVTSERGFDAVEIERSAIELQKRLADLEDERDFLEKRIADLEPWGDFELPPLKQMGGQRLWFYRVPHNLMPEVEATDLVWEIVQRDRRLCDVIVVAREEPEGMPVERTHTGARPRHVLKERLEEVILEIEDARAERASLTRWCTLMAKSLASLEDRAARANAAAQTSDGELLFAVQGWVPVDRVRELEAYASERGIMLERHAPAPEDEPPSLLRNRRGLDSGEDLVKFYMVPGYWTWDPSSVVLISFAIFFGMILADTGYALILAGLLAWLWKRMGRTPGGRRFRVTFAALTGATFVYGILVGSYFGVTPPPDSFLGGLHVLDLKDAPTMMAISIVIGVIHVVLANIMNARRFGRRVLALAPTGWACMVAGGLGLAAGAMLDVSTITRIAIVVMVVGAALVFIFTGAGQKPLKRFVSGALAFTNVTKAFGDVLSYLRLFALGLATASLAVAFNDMAGKISDAVPGVGMLAALLVLLIGHAMNLVLGIASGVIHGLRLNVIEFFNWGLKEEGRIYRPFERKEGMTWNP